MRLPPPVGVDGVEDWPSPCADSLLVDVLAALAVAAVVVVAAGEPPIARYPRPRLGGRERRGRSVVRTV
ncbi:MAG: hypothetical protein WAN93_04570, partial [Solirubrobacteraceae bacterium]